jgi:organic radical activating enzyme
MAPEPSNTLLNVAGVIIGSYTNGPGKRTVIWVQGCTLGCKGCFNASLQPHEPCHLVEPLGFADIIAVQCIENECEGITITGGEPFQQAVALNIFSRRIKEHGLTVVCFSGYRKETLFSSTSSHVRDLIRSVDILIAGPYNYHNTYPRTWSDDPDKEIVLLSRVYSEEDLKCDVQGELILLLEESQFTGFIGLEDRHLFKNILE